MAHGNDSCRKIQKALRQVGGRTTADTLSQLRKKLGLNGAMSTQDLEMNLRAMSGRELTLTATPGQPIKVELQAHR